MPAFHRRQFPAVSALSIGFTGCLSGNRPYSLNAGTVKVHWQDHRRARRSMIRRGLGDVARGIDVDALSEAEFNRF